MTIPRNFLAGTPVFSILLLAVSVGSVAATSGRAQSLEFGIEPYRARLIADVDNALASVRTLRTSAAAGDVAAAKQAWLEARVGWERSEIFTGQFVPALDRAIDAWPNGASGFHAVEGRLFGTGKTDFDPETKELERNLAELCARARDTQLTPQGLLDGVVALAYEVGESKVDGGESRISGTSLNDMRHNVDGIDFAWETIFASTAAARDPRLAGDVHHGIEAVRTLVAVPDLRHIDPARLSAATEELVVKLQDAAPLMDLRKPALEANVQQ